MMEMERSTSRLEATQAYKEKKLETMNKIASLIINDRDGILTPSNLNTLFMYSANSLLEHGLVRRGRIFEDIDTNRQVSELSINALEAQDRVLHTLGVDEMGDWGISFETKSELVDYLNRLNNEFEHELMKILEEKELTNG